MQGRTLALTVGLLSAGPAAAQGMPDMAAMQRAMEDMQQCMATVDMAAVERMAEDAKAFQKELESLCAAGRRAEAQRQAMSFSMRMMNEPETRKLRACAETMREAMAGMPIVVPMPPTPDVPTPEEIERMHVCDAIVD